MGVVLRAVRQQRGLALDELAAATGLTKSYLSKIERQRSTPSIAVAMKVARVLEVDVAQVFSEDHETTMLSVGRADAQRADHYSAVATDMLGKAMSPFIVRPTREFAEHPHPMHAGQEFVFVHSGRVELIMATRSSPSVPVTAPISTPIYPISCVSSAAWPAKWSSSPTLTTRATAEGGVDVMGHAIDYRTLSVR